MTSGVPSLSPRFYRAHGLGNDYLVFEAQEGEGAWPLTPACVRAVCDRHTGVGSDGIVALLDRDPRDGVFPLRMVNPDGSEFERSGNGLRVLGSYLSREGLTGGDSFAVRTGGDRVGMRVLTADAGTFDIEVSMGRARIGLEGVRADSQRLDAGGRVVHPTLGPIAFTPVNVGNPHAVVFPGDRALPLLDVGPFLETHPAFAAGVNVQLVRPLGRGGISIEIWERGAGPTTASGTSACAATVASVDEGFVDAGRVVVEMRGGTLEVTVTDDLDVTLRGPVEAVCEGQLEAGFVRRLRSALAPVE